MYILFKQHAGLKVLLQPQKSGLLSPFNSEEAKTTFPISTRERRASQSQTAIGGTARPCPIYERALGARGR